MEDIHLPPMDRRLQKRYLQLVQSHMRQASSTAAGPTAVLDQNTAFAATQGAWRFLNNERVTLSALIEPLRHVGCEQLAQSSSPVGLLMHDWSKLSYQNHRSKTDTLAVTHARDIGYDLACALLVNADDGSPIAPMQIQLKTANQVLSTDLTPPECDIPHAPHLAQLQATMQASKTWTLPKPVVHIIDREADSVAHYRHWHRQGNHFLTRCNDRRVCYQNRSMRMTQITEELLEKHTFDETRIVDYRGQKAIQFIACVPVILDRPAKRKINGRQQEIKGKPIELRLVISQIRNHEGKVLATWRLLSNVPPQVADAATLALWYYWRWRIESFFKLLKTHGQHIEQWQQTRGDAIAKRLLVAAMACVTVWELERQTTPQAKQLKDLLVRLSGRQMKRSRPHTSSALLAGLFVLLPTLELIKQYQGDLSSLQQLANITLPSLEHT